MDFLGLRNLTILGDALENVKLNQGIEIDLDELAKDPTDTATYELLSRGGDTTGGVFQFDSSGYQQLCRLMQPDRFADITALGALYRPGPMGTNTHTNYALRKNGEQAIEHIHPELAEALDDLLGETYGLLVYQEQVMAIAQKLAGYTLGNATCCAGRWARRRRKSSTPSSSTSRAACSPTGTPKKRSWRCGTPWCRSRTTASTSPMPRRTGWCRTGRRT